MDDLIRRSDAIRVASGYCHWSNIPKELAKLPSVSTEKTGRWIPVSERLPVEYGTYLICTDDGYVSTIIYDRSMGWLLSAKIIAWMPLPQPYKGESEVSDADSNYDI